MPGLLTRIVKNVLSPSATRRYPDEVRDPFPGVRGDVRADMETCRFCGKCTRVCPTGCLSVDKDAGVWERDPFSCIFCGACVDGCPTHSLRFTSRHMPPKFSMTGIRLTREQEQPTKKPKQQEETPMDTPRQWTTCRIDCPENRGTGGLLLEWTEKEGKPVLTGVHCDNPHLQDLSGGDCSWSCWDRLEKEAEPRS